MQIGERKMNEILHNHAQSRIKLRRVKQKKKSQCAPFAKCPFFFLFFFFSERSDFFGRVWWCEVKY